MPDHFLPSPVRTNISAKVAPFPAPSDSYERIAGVRVTGSGDTSQLQIYDDEGGSTEYECPIAPESLFSKEDTKNRMNDMLESLNADEVCVTDFNRVLDTQYESYQDYGSTTTSGGGGCLFGIIGCGGGASTTTDFGDFENEFNSYLSDSARSSGCGSLIASLTQVNTAVSMITCSITKCKSDTTISLTSGATIRIKTSLTQIEADLMSSLKSTRSSAV